jgi:hypothetical protein
VRRRADDGAVGDRVLGADEPPAGEGELVVGQSEGGVDRHGAAQVALRSRQVPAVQAVHAGEIAAVRCEGLSRGARQAHRQIGWGAREVEQLGRELVEERSGILARPVVHSRDADPGAAGHVVDSRGEMERVPHFREVTQHDGPHAGLAGEPAGHVEADVLGRLDAVLAEQVVEPLLVNDREIVPLREVEPEHAHTALAHPVHRVVVAHVVERQHQNRVARVHALRRAVASSGDADGGADRGERHRHGEQRRPAGRPFDRDGPLARDRLAQLLARLPAFPWVLLQGAHDGAGQGLGALGPHPLDGDRSLGDVLGDYDPVGALEGRVPRQHLVGDHAEAVEIAPAVHLLARRLLGAHVARGSDCHALPRAGHSLRRHGPGDAEVGQEGAPAPALEQDVLGLHVAVHHARSGGGVERGRQVRHDPDDVRDRQLALPVETLPQGLALDLVHDVIEEALRGAGRVDGDDAGMAETGDGARFGEEPAHDRGVGGQLGVHDLDGDGAVERGVGRAEHDTHAATAQLPLQPVLRLERCLECRERLDRRMAHARTARRWTVRGIYRVRRHRRMRCRSKRLRRALIPGVSG